MKPTVLIIQIPLSKAEVLDRNFSFLDEVSQAVATACDLDPDKDVLQIQMLDT